MNVTLFMAMSVNGIVARSNGDEDFLSEANWKMLIRLAKRYGNVVWGRKTYETVRRWGKHYLRDLRGVRIVVVSRHGKGYARSPREAINQLRRAGFTHALLSGGPTLNMAFARAKLIDELILSVEPIVVGNGLPVFANGLLDVKLKLRRVQRSGRLLMLHYHTT